MAKSSKKKKGKINELFPEKRSKDMTRISLYISQDLREKIVEASEKSGQPLNKIMTRILEKFFEE